MMKDYVIIMDRKKGRNLEKMAFKTHNDERALEIAMWEIPGADYSQFDKEDYLYSLGSNPPKDLTQNWLDNLEQSYDLLVDAKGGVDIQKIPIIYAVINLSENKVLFP